MKTAQDAWAVFVQNPNLQTSPASDIIDEMQKEGNDMRQLTPLFFNAPGLGAYRFYFPL